MKIEIEWAVRDVGQETSERVVRGGVGLETLLGWVLEVEEEIAGGEGGNT